MILIRNKKVSLSSRALLPEANEEAVEETAEEAVAEEATDVE